MKKALLCGLNYIDTNAELSGCINDVENTKKMLIEQYDYKPENILILSDNSLIKPTKENIIKYLKELVAESEYNQLYFHYSGHGSYILDRNSDEDDNKDECLIPLDYMDSGFISDDQIKNIVTKLSPEKKLVMVIDACHSGTMVDLRYKMDCLSVNQNEKHDNLDDDTYLFKDWSYDFQISQDNKYSCESNIMTLSGCRDAQTSADAFINRKFQGALTYHFLKVLELNQYKIKLKYLLKDIHCMLKRAKYDQKPVIQSSNSIVLDEFFIL